MSATDRDFEDWVARARQFTCAEVAEKRGLALSKGRVERTGPCPGCGGKDRFRINVTKDFFACRQCGKSGRSILLMQLIDDCDFLAACETLAGEAPPKGEGVRPSPAELAAREAERAAKAAADEEKSAGFREAERARLYAMWQSARRGAQPVADYFARRGIRLPPAFCGRFLAGAPYFHGNDANGRWRMIHRGPAMLLPITDADGTFRGLHITWLDLTRPKGKAEIFDADTGELLPAKKVRGSKKGNRILLVPAQRAPTRQVAGEGPETVLSVYTADLLLHRLREDTEYVSSVDLGNLAGRAEEGCRLRHPTQTLTDKLGRVRPTFVPGPEPDFSSPALWVSEAISHLTLLADGDSDPFFTRAAMERAQARHAAPGRHVTTAWPPEGMDFNNVLMGDHLRGAAA